MTSGSLREEISKVTGDIGRVLGTYSYSDVKIFSGEYPDRNGLALHECSDEHLNDYIRKQWGE